MSQVHVQAVTLEQMIGRSELILVVSKTEPHLSSEEVFIDANHAFPPYVWTYSHFLVRESLFDGKSRIKVGDAICVSGAMDEMRLELHKNYYLEGESKSPVSAEYDCGVAYDQLKDMIIFLRYRGDCGLAFIVDGAWEKNSAREAVLKFIQQAR